MPTSSLSARQRIAVVGTGAAGLGVLSTLLRANHNLEISIIDPGRRVRSIPNLSDESKTTVSAYYSDLYRTIRKRFPRAFPPPKTHFGEQIPKLDHGGHLKIYQSDTFGGLTNFWGGTTLPFTNRELSGWPFDRTDLDPYYQQIAEVIGLSGCQDRLSEYFGNDYSSRPPLRPTALLRRLDASINSSPLDRTFRIVSGVNRCALETRPDQPRTCVYCGECMLGCFRDSVYSTRQTIAEYLDDCRISAVIRKRVHRINDRNGHVDVQLDGDATHLQFDKVFLCAGCPATTEILMRSRGLQDGPVMKDNAVYVFPILFWKGLPRAAINEPYLALCNLILGCIPRAQDSHFAQISIYPNFDYLWRYNIPPRLWSMFRTLMGSLPARLFWGRLYVHSDHSQSYAAHLTGDRLIFRDHAQPEKSSYVKQLMSDVRSTLSGRGFWVPRGAVIRQKTNSHYVGTFPYGGQRLAMPPTGEVLKRVYVCDATTFPTAPAINPTFSIMANAARTAHMALDH